MESKSGGERRIKGSKTSEMAIFTKAKELISMTYLICENWPKKYRFDLTNRVRNIALNIYDNLMEANEIYVDPKFSKSNAIENPTTVNHEQNNRNLVSIELLELYKVNKLIFIRRHTQNMAFAELKKLDFLFSEAYSRRLISSSKWEKVSGLILETTHLLKAWMRSDQKRLGT